MAVSILDNWDYRGKKPDFTRNLFQTVDEMVAFSENYLPPVYECNVVENGNRYRYNVSNIEDPILGKWRLVESSGGAMDLMDYYKKTEVDTLLQNKVDVDPDKDLMLLTERQQLADNTDESHKFIEEFITIYLKKEDVISKFILSSSIILHTVIF